MNVEIKILNKEFYTLGVNVKPISATWGLNLPSYATKGSAAIDLRTTTEIVLRPGDAQLIKTGLAIWIRDNDVCALILPRSGLGHKDGVVLGNLIGLIDSDYQGELMISLWNRCKMARQYSKGAKIAQMVFLPIVHPQFKIVDNFSNETKRGQGGFGSTGV